MPDRRMYACLVAACVATIAGPAQGGVSARLIYSRSRPAAACPDQQALERAVAARLGYNPFVGWAEQTIVAEVTSSGDALRARAQLVGKDGVVQGSRELTGSIAQCEDLIASLALAISITLDPMSLTSGASASTAPEPPGTTPLPPVAVVGEPNARATVDSPASSASRPRNDSPSPALSGAAELGPFVGFGFLPNAAPGIRGGARLASGRLSLGLDVAWLLASTEAATDGGSVQASLLLASVFPCVDIGPIATCALASIGRLHGTGQGVDLPREESRLYAALGLRAIGAMALGSGWALVVHGDAEKALTFPMFQLNGRDVWRPSSFVASTGIALSLRFL
jgi:hypothetical protein